MASSFKDLVAWQQAVELVVEVYRVTKAFPREEMFGLTIQLRRAAVSIPSNIAEGQGRGNTPDFARYLRVAQGSLQEVETQVVIAHCLGMVGDHDRDALFARITSVGKLMRRLSQSLRPSRNEQPATSN
jgi:four helix bundle protein